MLKIAEHLDELDFRMLMEIYVEGNQENGEILYPDLPKNEQVLLAESDFYHYLRDSFFTTKGAFYAVWIENERYVSALRLEPYREGLLLEALETAPEERRKGYAKTLLKAVQHMLIAQGEVCVYSHISKWNLASIATHRACDFKKVLDYAVYVDGSVSQNAATYCWRAK